MLETENENEDDIAVIGIQGQLPALAAIELKKRTTKVLKKRVRGPISQSNVSAAARVVEFKGNYLKISAFDRSKLVCGICAVTLDTRRRSNIVSHLKSKVHLKREKEEQGAIAEGIALSATLAAQIQEKAVESSKSLTSEQKIANMTKTPLRTVVRRYQ